MDNPNPNRRRRRQRQRERNAEDRISSLPDEILHRILSFLEFSDLIITPFLSSRYRYLWTSVPSLTLDTLYTCPVIFEAGLLFSSPQTLRLSFDPYHHRRIPTWIRFAVNRHVRNLHLTPSHSYSSDEPLPKIHSSLYTSPSLEFLKLRFCDLNLSPSTTINLPSLKTLRIERSTLTDTEIARILSGCPALEDLSLVYCNSDVGIKVDASEHRSLRNLEIYDCKEVDGASKRSGVEVVAPGLLSLRIAGCLRGYFYSLGKLGALVSASFEFRGVLKLHGSCNVALMRLLAAVSSARRLKLGSWCIQVLSLQEVKNEGPVVSSATHLEMDVGLVKWDLLGMAYLLKSFPDLEELVINIDEHAVYLDLHNLYDGAVIANHVLSRHLNKFDGNMFWKSLDVALSCRFKHLKTIRIYGFMGSKQISPKEGESLSINEFVNRRKSEIELVNLLLKNSPVLGKMVISTKFFYSREDEFILKSKQVLNLQLHLSRRLLLLHRASPTAEIVFT